MPCFWCSTWSSIFTTLHKQINMCIFPHVIPTDPLIIKKKTTKKPLTEKNWPVRPGAPQPGSAEFSSQQRGQNPWRALCTAGSHCWRTRHSYGHIHTGTDSGRAEFSLVCSVKDEWTPVALKLGEVAWLFCEIEMIRSLLYYKQSNFSPSWCK